MKLKDIETVLNILKKISMPISPKSRYTIFKLIEELETEHKIYNSVKKSYITDEFISLEQKKYEFVKSFESNIGVDIFGIKVDKAKVNMVVSHLEELSNTSAYKAYLEFVEFSNEPFFQKTRLLNIDELSDDVFDTLTPEEIEMLMLVIK